MAYEKKEYEKKDGDIVLFANKKTKDTQPDFKGTVLLGGKELDVALWKRTSQAGNTFLSGKVSQPMNKEQQPKKEETQNIDDECPF